MIEAKFEDVMRRLKEGAELTTDDIARQVRQPPDVMFDRLAREGRSLGLECRGGRWRYNVGPGSPFATDRSPLLAAS